MIRRKRILSILIITAISTSCVNVNLVNAAESNDESLLQVSENVVNDSGELSQNYENSSIESDEDETSNENMECKIQESDSEGKIENEAEVNENETLNEADVLEDNSDDNIDENFEDEELEKNEDEYEIEDEDESMVYNSSLSEDSEEVIWGEDKDYHWNDTKTKECTEEINHVYFGINDDNKTIYVKQLCDGTTSIKLPKQVRIDGEYYTLTKFGKQVDKFADFNSISIPSTVIDGIDGETFDRNKNILSICVNKNNPVYKSYQNVLYKGDELIQAPPRISGTCNILDGTIKIADDAFYNCSSLKKVVFPESLKQIGQRAFMYCEVLDNVVIPENVTDIDDYAFCRCEEMSSIDLPEKLANIGDYIFAVCEGLQSVDLSKTNIRELPDFSFSSCASLNEIIFPESLTAIGQDAFINCKNIKYIEIPDKVNIIGNGAFKSCKKLESIRIPTGITAIANNVFNECENLKAISIPNGVTSIGDESFRDCKSLRYISIPETVESMGKNAFILDSNIQSIWCPSDLYKKFYDKFSYYANGPVNIDSNLYDRVNDNDEIIKIKPHQSSTIIKCYEKQDSGSEVEVPLSKDSDGYYIQNLEKSKEPRYYYYVETTSSYVVYRSPVIKVQSNIYTSWNNNEYKENGITYIKTSEDTVSIKSCDKNKVGDLELSGEITVEGRKYIVNGIEESAFSGCTKLNNIILSTSITKIGDLAFRDCTDLTSIAIPKGITEIGEETFNNCTNLESIAIPDSVEFIDESAFKDCNNLKSVWASLFEYNKFKDSFNEDSNVISIQSNLYNREKYISDVIKVKADNVKCFEKLSDGSKVEVDVTIDREGKFIHDPSRLKVGTKYYSYEAVEDGMTYESPIISVTVNDEDVIPEAFGEKNEYLLNNIKYKFNHDNFIMLSGIMDDSESIDIPSSVTIDERSYEVASIADCAFLNNKTLRTVTTTSNNLYYIGWEAFYGCSNLSSITIPASVTTIGDEAFYGCSMDSLVFIINNESSKDVLLAAGINTDNVVMNNN